MPQVNWAAASVRKILIAAFLVIISIIIGFTVPSPSERFQRSATGCPYGIQKWNPLECAGVDIVYGAVWNQIISPVDTFVRMLELSASAVCIIPPNQVTDKRPYRSLSLKVVVSGVLHGSESHSVLHEDTHQLDDACSESSVLLYKSTSAVYSEYALSVTAFAVNESLPLWLADVHFQFRLGKATYSIFEVCLQTLFFLMACGCFVWWCLYAFSAPLRLWTLHHVWTTVLVTVMLAYFQPILLASHLLVGQTLLASSASLLKAFFFTYVLFYGVTVLADYSSTRLNIVVQCVLGLYCLLFFVLEFALIILSESIKTYTSSERVEYVLIAMVVIYAIVVALWSLRVLMTWSEKPRSAENFAEFVSFLFASAMLGIGVVVVKVLNARDIGSTLALPFSLELGLVFAYVLCVATPGGSGGSVGSTDLLISVEASEEDEAVPTDVHHDDDAAGVELTSISKR